MGHVHGIVLQKAQNNPASQGLRVAHFSQKTRQMLLLKSALKANVKSKTLGEESPVAPYVNLADQPS
ncbi:MAG: hypothetical protein H7834_13390 [Magnetococcus sp. YQC-9]